MKFLIETFIFLFLVEKIKKVRNDKAPISVDKISMLRWKIFDYSYRYVYLMNLFMILGCLT